MTRMLAAAVVAVVSVFYDLDEVIICLMLCNPTEAIHSFAVFSIGFFALPLAQNNNPRDALVHTAATRSCLIQDFLHVHHPM